jgi:preprotein translocase subunit SecG
VEVALNLVTIIVSIVLIVIVLLQTKGSSFSGAFGGGGSDSIQRTRRGFEKTLFQFTIGTSVFFVILCIMSSIVLSS